MKLSQVPIDCQWHTQGGRGGGNPPPPTKSEKLFHKNDVIFEEYVKSMIFELNFQKFSQRLGAPPPEPPTRLYSQCIFSPFCAKFGMFVHHFLSLCGNILGIVFILSFSIIFMLL